MREGLGMSEIKVGDKAKAYICYDRSYTDNPEEKVITGKVREIRNNSVKIKYSSSEDSIKYDCEVWVHRKQCRKLVKKVKFDECEGDKVMNEIKVKCYWCNGTGEINSQSNYRPSALALVLSEKVKLMCPNCNGSGKISLT